MPTNNNNTAMKTQFITDNQGKKIAVILPVKDYEKLMEELDDIEDIRLYDQAKKEDDGQRIVLSEYLKNRKAKNA
jgi:PHD/YefM family antitoxin component YafN of YafNO toxin-antitoxin module